MERRLRIGGIIAWTPGLGLLHAITPQQETQAETHPTSIFSLREKKKSRELAFWYTLAPHPLSLFISSFWA